MTMLAVALAALLPQNQDPAADQRQPMPLPAAAACRRGDARIAIDGSLLDWPSLPLIDLADPRQLSGTANGAWRSPSDLSGYAFLMWDDRDLYFAASIKDEWHRPLDRGAFAVVETPAADSIVLTFDPLRNTRALGPDPGRADDVELWLGEEPSHRVVQWDRLRGTARLLGSDDEGADDDSRMVVSHDKEQSITSYEMRVAWSHLLPPGRKPEAGMAFDLQVVVNDYDETTDPMPQTRIGWTFGCGVVIDPCLYGTVVLVGDKTIGSDPPVVPARPEVPIPPELSIEHWQEFAQQLRAHPPTLHDGKRAPEEAGGIARLELLETLEREVDRYPRVDFVEYCQRAHRQMQREVAGIEQTGLPSFWNIRSRQVADEAAAAAQPGTARVFRLPQNGWLVRGERYGFLVDPAGGRAPTHFWGASDFCVLTEPLDLARRNDALLLRMSDAKPQRPWLTHVAFHLPRTLMADMSLMTPGTNRRQSDGVDVVALSSVRPDGKVPVALGYLFELPGKLRLLVAGAGTTVADLPTGLQDVDCAILTARNPASLELAAALHPRLVLVDGAFACHQLPGDERVELRMAHAMQKLLLPTPSVLLAPGESWELAARH